LRVETSQTPPNMEYTQQPMPLQGAVPSSGPVYAPVYDQNGATTYAAPQYSKPAVGGNNVMLKVQRLMMWLTDHGTFTLGFLMLLLLIIMPMWNSIRLLYDQVFVYFVGRVWPFFTILACLGSVLLYVALYRHAQNLIDQEEYRHDHTHMKTVMSTVLATLGLLLVLISLPIQRESQLAYNDVSFDCDRGTSTVGLFSYASALKTIRTSSTCSTFPTVEQCDGFQHSQPFTGFLKYLELSHECAGFCSSVNSSSAAIPPVAPAPAGPAAAAPSLKPVTLEAVIASKLEQTGAPQNQATPRQLSAPAASAGSYSVVSPSSNSAPSVGPTASSSTKGGHTLVDAMQHLAAQKTVEIKHEKLQKKQHARPRSLQQGLALLAPARGLLPKRLQQAAHASSKLMRTSNSSAPTYPQPGKIAAYPPTLFSSANYQASCDGMVMLSLRHGAVEAGKSLFLEGVILLFIACAIALLGTGWMLFGALYDCTGFRNSLLKRNML